jgi:ribonucleotide monophosphatase NagD (HAD superfamily)
MIVEAAAQKLDLPLNALGMIGDRLYTDIALGQTSGITTVLVLSGETRAEDLADSPYKPTYLFDHLGAVANWLSMHG